jgi:hypothetical protein
MGLFSFFFGGMGRGKSVKVYGKGARRTFATYPKRPNPNSRRSTGNTSRYKRF